MSIEMPSPQMVTLRFADRRVVVQGRNLEPVYDALVSEKLAQLREADVDWASESETFISKMTIVRSPEHE
jgi:glutathione peroxidase-family protein